MKIHVTFNGELVNLLPGVQRENEGSIEKEYHGKRTVKDLVQSLGVPHTEIGLVRVGVQSVDLSYILQDGDRLEIFPVSPPVLLPVPGVPRFICDVHLWKLARRLRLLGFDALFNPAWDDEQLAEISFKENLILLTRDRGLLMRNAVKTGLLIRDTNTDKQVIETFRRFDVGKWIRPFTRCMVCGGILELVDMNGDFFKDKLIIKIPAKVLKRSSEFQVCLSCEKVYWKGSHYEKLSRLLDTYLLI